MREMKDKIELYREARLWIKQVIVPLAAFGILYYINQKSDENRRMSSLKNYMKGLI